jgi:Family of unknown function (DUF6152)
MKAKQRFACVLGAASLGAALPALAHHGQAGLFDTARVVELTGTVKEWSFVNPHPVLTIEVGESNGARTEWEVYFGPQAVSHMRQRGFSAGTFKAGETLVVSGHPATTKGAHGIDVWGGGTSVKRGDGSAVP